MTTSMSNCPTPRVATIANGNAVVTIVQPTLPQLDDRQHVGHRRRSDGTLPRGGCVRCLNRQRIQPCHLRTGRQPVHRRGDGTGPTTTRSSALTAPPARSWASLRPGRSTACGPSCSMAATCTWPASTPTRCCNTTRRPGRTWACSSPPAAAASMAPTAWPLAPMATSTSPGGTATTWSSTTARRERSSERSSPLVPAG